MKYIMENGHVESFKTVGSQTGPEVAVNGNGKLEKHGSSGRGTSFFNASSSKSPKNKTGIGSQTPKSPRTPKTPKGRTILESKVRNKSLFASLLGDSTTPNHCRTILIRHFAP